METDFKQLSNDTLAIIKGYGIKSKTVYHWQEQTCGMLKTYLEESDLDFSFENGQAWLTEICPREPVKYSQYVRYLAHRRTVFLLAECQSGALGPW